jgi:hypothetical protein
MELGKEDWARLDEQFEQLPEVLNVRPSFTLDGTEGSSSNRIDLC